MLIRLSDPEKLLKQGRPGQKLRRVFKDAPVSYLILTAYEWERVLEFQVGDMNGSSRLGMH